MSGERRSDGVLRGWGTRAACPGSSRRGRGSLGRALVPPATGPRAAAANGRVRIKVLRGLGGGLPPSSQILGWQAEAGEGGRRKRTPNKETRAGPDGSRGPGTAGRFGNKGDAGLGWLAVPSPKSPNRCGSAAGPPSRGCGTSRRCPEASSGPTSRLSAPPPAPLITGFVTGAIRARPRAWFRVSCFSSLRG